MNLGNVTRGAALAVFAVSALTANAQSVSMWWNKQGDAAATQPATVDVLAGSTVTLSFYMSTSNFTGGITQVYSMVGFDTTTSMGNSASPAGSGITLNGSVAWDTTSLPGGSNLGDTLGGGYGTSGTRPYGVWASYVRNTGNFGFTNSSNLHIFDVTLNVSNTLTAGTLRPVTIFSAPSLPGFYDTEVWDTNNLAAAPQTYVANLRVVNPVPEPASLAALGIGAAALLRRRKK